MKRKNHSWLMAFLLVLGLAGNSLAEPLFGPQRYERAAGAPEVHSNTFQACNTGATYHLVAENGAAGKDRVSSATISLNGVEVLRPSDLNQRVDRVEKEIALQGDNTLDVRLTSNPGGFLTVSVICVSGCLDVSITSPTPDSTVNRSTALVKGSLLNTSGETGVILTSAGAQGEAAELAQVQSDLFAGLVPLQTGENTITATATDACGYQVHKEITVHAASVPERVHLGAFPWNGILAAGGTKFDVDLEAEVDLPNPTVNYAWDFDGDGTTEESGSDLSKTVAHYGAPGLYLPTVTVTDSQGHNYSETTVVQVFSRESFDALLKGKWEGMKKALARGDVEKAVVNFTERSRNSFRQQFSLLSKALPRIVNEMGEATLIEVQGDRAIYDLRTVRNGSVYSFQLEFVRDGDGIWRIRSF